MTTEIEELVKRARDYEYVNEFDAELGFALADALEAQAAMVKETQRSLDLAMQRSNAWRDRAEKAENRIAAIEAQLDIANKQIAETGRAWAADRERLEAQLQAFRDGLERVSAFDDGGRHRYHPGRDGNPELRAYNEAGDIARDSLMSALQMARRD